MMRDWIAIGLLVLITFLSGYAPVGVILFSGLLILNRLRIVNLTPMAFFASIILLALFCLDIVTYLWASNQPWAEGILY